MNPQKTPAEPSSRAPARTAWKTNNTRTFLVLVGAAAALTLTSCKKEGPAQLPPPIVEVVTVAATNATLSAEFVGQLDSPQNVEVRARVEAFVDKVLFTEGTEVKEGDPLFALDKQPFEERLAAAKGMLAEAKAALAKCQADVNRLTPLAKAKAIPLQDLDNAQASVAVSQASVESAEARVKSAVLDLGYCDVRAPLSGLIGAKQVSVGSLVGKGQPTLLATISQLDPIWFYCSISEVDYLRAERRVRESGQKLSDMPVILILADGSEHPQRGKFVFLDRAVDVTTGTLRARVQFPNPSKVLRPGMFARIRIDAKSDQKSILAPERSIVELQGKTFVWVIGPDNKATQRPVRLGTQNVGENVMIIEGINPGDRVVTEGLQKVREGLLVNPMTATEMAEAAAQNARRAETNTAKEGEPKHSKE